MNDLKPCPFCGGNAEMKTYTRFWVVRDDCLTESATYPTEEEAIEAWNRRAEVVHGRWEDGICTMCGYPIPTDSKCDFIDEDDCLFCYHCGAKMKGENEDG